MTRSIDPFSDSATLATVAGQFEELELSLAAGAPEPLTQQRLVQFAVRGIPGAEHASVTVVHGGRAPRTAAASDELTPHWDQLQYDCGEGPGLDVIASNGFELVADLSTDTRWPRFARAVIAQTPARSMLSFRLFLNDEDRAGLNLYATRPGAFTDRSVATGSMFAAYASMALLAAARLDTVGHLTRALETNREIGVAMGILMTKGLLTRSQAFEQLRLASQALNRKLYDIAGEVATTGALPVIPPKTIRP
jgi:hypothetical protein